MSVSIDWNGVKKTYVRVADLTISFGDGGDRQVQATRYYCEDDQSDLIVYSSSDNSSSEFLGIESGSLSLNNPGEGTCQRIDQPLKEPADAEGSDPRVYTKIRGRSHGDFVEKDYCTHGSTPGGSGYHMSASQDDIDACRALYPDEPLSYCLYEWV